MRLAARTGRPQTAKPSASNGAELYSKHTNDLESKLASLNQILKKNYEASHASSGSRYHKLEVKKAQN